MKTMDERCNVVSSSCALHVSLSVYRPDQSDAKEYDPNDTNVHQGIQNSIVIATQGSDKTRVANIENNWLDILQSRKS